ncbi:division/cell wall cluster transcriptional repressor MraZ [Spiroplasma endosymbiont of Anurida maritima]|uniref:division/cell wall cluster transcriptional repressor MraZ n=1 Tax=Spiroplasma endosymbiont of Anurida maritima TaxID=2967972 RepID=UPI0036D3F1E5
MILLGKYNHKFDEKGRLALPAKFREHFVHKQVYISIGFDGCVDIRNEENWNKWVNQLSLTGQATKEGRALKRKIMSLSNVATFDSQGRININSELKTLSNIKKDVLIIGNNDHLEVWDEDSWNNYLKNEAPSLEEAALKFEDKV